MNKLVFYVYYFSFFNMPTYWVSFLVTGWQTSCYYKENSCKKCKGALNEGGVYKISYFNVVPSIGSHRTTRYEYKIIFHFRTTISPIECKIIQVTGLSITRFEEIFQMVEKFDYLVGKFKYFFTVIYNLWY